MARHAGPHAAGPSVLSGLVPALPVLASSVGSLASACALRGGAVTPQSPFSKSCDSFLHFHPLIFKISSQAYLLQETFSKLLSLFVIIVCFLTSALFTTASNPC